VVAEAWHSHHPSRHLLQVSVHLVVVGAEARSTPHPGLVHRLWLPLVARELEEARHQPPHRHLPLEQGRLAKAILLVPASLKAKKVLLLNVGLSTWCVCVHLWPVAPLLGLELEA